MSSLLRKFTSDSSSDNKISRPMAAAEDTYTPPSRSRDYNPPIPPQHTQGRIDQNKTNLCSDVEFKGAISFKDFLRLDGKFEGDINSPGTLIIGENGIVKAEITIGNIIIEGKIYGNITAQDKIELRGNAQLFGDIKATRLVVSEGVVFVGRSDVNPNNKIEKLVPKASKPEIVEQHSAPAPEETPARQDFSSVNRPSY